jgi:FkbM family methyltransferase
MKKAFFDIGPGVLNSEAWQEKWKDYQIIGVEPDPERYATLEKTYPGILLNCAISDKEEILEFVKHPTSGYIAYSYPNLIEKHTVAALTIDMLDEKYGPFDEIAIWADIEGSELRMLQGASKTLDKVTSVLVELHTCPQTDNWCSSSEVYDFLIAHGFKATSPERQRTEIDSNYDVLFVKQ